MSEPPAPNEPRSTSVAGQEKSWAWPVTWMVVTAMLVAGGVYIFKSCRDLPGDTMDRAGKLAQTIGQEAREVASAFKQGTITTIFTSEATTLSGSQFLQFATLSQHETFTRTDESTTLFGYVPLPELIVQASAPVTYTYYLDLNAPWDFALRDGVIWVTAPDIKYNKPALDVSRITYEVKKDSHIRNTSEAIENLRSSMTWMCYEKARSNIQLVRETGRKQTESFVENWLAKSFADGKKYPVKVRFRSERLAVPPVVTLPDQKPRGFSN